MENEFDNFAIREITTYSGDGMFWADASQRVDVTPDAAWHSLEPLVMRLMTIPSAGGDSVEVQRVFPAAPFVHVGNRLVSKAVMLAGIIKTSMTMEITAADPPRYLRPAVHVFTRHVADVDFRIVPDENGCRLTYRQGYRSKENLLGWIGDGVKMAPRDMPENARIFNMWVEIALAGA